MRSFVRVGLWCIVCLLLASNARAADPNVKEMLLSLAHPLDSREVEARLDSDIEKILSDSLMNIERRTGATVVRERRGSSGDRLFPGSSSLDAVANRGARVVSARPAAALSEAGEILDMGPGFENAGSTVGDPVHLYSTFEILVDKHDYTVRLFGVKKNGEKAQLFDCKAGLGSPEYPTPRGVFYLYRIFDDKPLWIPPPSDWAYGESPSHSVYGGHMLPLFKKVPAVGNDKSVEVLDDDDILAPLMKIIDSGGYRIHGTNSPWSIGSGQSHGCVRLLNSTVKRLADTLKMYVGTTERGKTPNGSYITLARPVKVTLY
jgi:L,D-transpeptidase ErfK/SrfK